MSLATPSTAAQVQAEFEPFASTIAALWTGLRAGLSEKHTQSLRLGFTACAHRDGTTTVATCAAISLALHGGEEVVLVEASRSSPSMAESFGIPRAPGLEELCRGGAPLEQALRATDVPGLFLLPIGGSARPEGKSGGTAPWSGAPRAAELMSVWERLSGGKRHVLVDAPPFAGHPEAVPILASLDGVALVLNARRTRKGRAQSSMRALEDTGIRCLGTILNRCSLDLPAWLTRRRS